MNGRDPEGLGVVSDVLNSIIKTTITDPLNSVPHVINSAVDFGTNMVAMALTGNRKRVEKFNRQVTAASMVPGQVAVEVTNREIQTATALRHPIKTASEVSDWVTPEEAGKITANAAGPTAAIATAFTGVGARNAAHYVSPEFTSGAEVADSSLAQRQQIAQQLHAIELGADPARGSTVGATFSAREAATGLRLEARVGRLSRSTGVGDWVATNGRVYDAVGPVPTGHFSAASFNAAIESHFLKSGVDVIVVDLTGVASSDAAAVESYVKSLSATQRAKVMLIR